MLRFSNPIRRFFTFVFPLVLLCAAISIQNGWQRAAAEQSNLPQADLSVQNSIENSFGAAGVYFEANRGQQDSRVRYLTRGTNATLFLTATEAVYVMRNAGRGWRSEHVSAIESSQSAIRNPQQSERALAIYMTLAGANRDAEFAGHEQLAHRTNYFKGNDSSKWQTDVPNYGRVSAENIYDGVDIVWHGKQNGEVQYDFIVEPNANPNQIEWRIDGARNVSIDADGGLLIETELGTLRQGKPFSYQETANRFKQEIQSGYVISENRQSFSVRFELGEYDRSKPLTIDPSVNLSNLAFSTFLGGVGNDYGDSIALDAAGNVYVTGNTTAPSFPTTAGTFDTSHNGEDDAFVVKLNASGTALIYSTFLGGSANDNGVGIAADSSGNVYLTGGTSDGATDFPTTAGALQTTHNGGGDAFVTKLNASGTALIYSTFLGGSGSDVGLGIAADSSGNVYLTGYTQDGATDFPTTAGAFDTTHNGGGDAFVTKLNASGTALIYSTFLGGNNDDDGRGIAADSLGNVYLTGYTQDDAIDFPITAGAFDTTHNGSLDAFVTKLNASGTALIYSSFLGGSANDFGSGIAADSSGNVYLSGNTSDGATDFPTTTGAFDPTHNGDIDAFVAKLNASGTALIYSTFLGGTGSDYGLDIAIDSSGNAFLTGQTADGTTDFPTTPDAFDPTHNGGAYDAFVTKLNAGGTALIYSSFLGGSSGDGGYGIVVDSSGNIYLSGTTFDGTTDYPTTPNAFQPLINRFYEVFVTKLGNAVGPTAAPARLGGKVRSTAGNAPLPNTIVLLTDVVTPANSRTVVTDQNGDYSFDGMPTGRFYLIFALRDGYDFNPNEYGIFHLGDNINFDFLAAPNSSHPMHNFDGDGKSDFRSGS